MLYGLTKMPVVFQDFMKEIFRVLLQQCAIDYIGDILVSFDTSIFLVSF